MLSGRGAGVLKSKLPLIFNKLADFHEYFYCEQENWGCDFDTLLSDDSVGNIFEALNCVRWSSNFSIHS